MSDHAPEAEPFAEHLANWQNGYAAGVADVLDKVRNVFDGMLHADQPCDCERCWYSALYRDAVESLRVQS